MTTPTPAQQLEPMKITEADQCVIDLERVLEYLEEVGYTAGGDAQQCVIGAIDYIRRIQITRALAALAASEAAAAQAERRHQECGVEARIMYEDPRYPTLVLEGREFGTIGYDLRRETGELRRVCICFAYCERECVCGYDAAISAEREG